MNTTILRSAFAGVGFAAVLVLAPAAFAATETYTADLKAAKAVLDALQKWVSWRPLSALPAHWLAKSTARSELGFSE